MNVNGATAQYIPRKLGLSSCIYWCKLSIPIPWKDRTFDVRPPVRLSGCGNKMEMIMASGCSTTCRVFILSEKVAVAARSLKEQVPVINTID